MLSKIVKWCLIVGLVSVFAFSIVACGGDDSITGSQKKAEKEEKDPDDGQK